MNEPGSSASQAKKTHEMAETNEAQAVTGTLHRRVLESMLDAYLLADLSGRFREWNQASEQMFGYSAEEFRQLSYRELTPARWHELDERVTSEQVLTRGYSELYEKECVRKDGTVFPVELRVHLLRDDDGRPAAMWAVVRDLTERRADEAIRSRLFRVLESSLNEIYLFDSETLRFRYVNAAACRNLGYTLGELSQMTLVELKPAYTPESFRQAIEPLVTGEATKILFETVHRRKDGSVYPVEVHLQHMVSDGRSEFLAIIHDVTESRRAQADLEQSLVEAELRAGLSRALARARTEDEILEALGDSVDAFPGVLLTLIMVESAASGSVAVVRRIRNLGSAIEPPSPTGTHLSLEALRLLRALTLDEPWESDDVQADARLAPVLRDALFSPDAHGAAVFSISSGGLLFGHLVASVRDPRRLEAPKAALYRGLVDESAMALRSLRLNEAVRASERRLSLLVVESPLAVIEFDLARRIVAWNLAAERVFGRTSDEMMGRRLTELIGDDARLPSFAEPFHVKFETARLDGTMMTGEWFGAPLLGELGELLGGVVRVMDVTTRERALAEQVKLEAELARAQRLESIGRLAGGVAHDVNNMLTVILGYAELLASSTSPSDPRLVDLREIQAAARRSQGITRQLLAFSRQQASAPRRLDFASAIDALQKSLARVVGEDIVFRFLRPAEPWPALADSAQLDQIVMNLVVNARDAMPHGGTLTLELENVTLEPEDCQGRVEARPGRFLRLAVHDEGVGMDAVTLAQIFEPFFTTKENGKGTGLGLPTVYGIVSQNGGFIEVSSAPGAGTRFDVYWPKAEGDDEPARAEPAPAAARGGGTILLVEDDALVRRVTHAMLTRLGYRVLAASGARDAGELIRGEREVALLMTDVVMPHTSGPELAQELTRQRPGLKVLFVSGHGADILGERGVLSSGVCYLQKPFTEGELAEKLREVLGAVARAS